MTPNRCGACLEGFSSLRPNDDICDLRAVPLHAVDSADLDVTRGWRSDLGSSGTPLLLVATDEFVLLRYAVTSNLYNADEDPKSWELQASNDRLTFVTIDRQNEVLWASRGSVRTFDVSSARAYRFFRFVVSAIRNVDYTGSILLEPSETTVGTTKEVGVTVTKTNAFTPSVGVSSLTLYAAAAAPSQGVSSSRSSSLSPAKIAVVMIAVVAFAALLSGLILRKVRQRGAQGPKATLDTRRFLEMNGFENGPTRIRTATAQRVA